MAKTEDLTKKTDDQLSEQLRKRYPQSKERASLERRAFDE